MGLPPIAVTKINKKNALLRARQQKCCRRLTNQHTPAEHRGAYCKKTFVTEQLVYKNKAFIIVLQRPTTKLQKS